MTTSRIILLSLALLLALLCGAGFYAYQRFPLLLQQQAEYYLRDYGVEEVRLGRLQFTSSSFSAAEVLFRGERDGLVFEALLISLAVDFDWRGLRRGRVNGVSLADLRLSARETRGADNPAKLQAASVSGLLPYPLWADLPLKTLSLAHWSLDYQSPGIAPLLAQGSLQLAEQLRLQFSAGFDSLRLLGSAGADNSEPLSVELQLFADDQPLGSLQARLEAVTPAEWLWTGHGDLQYAPTLQSWPLLRAALRAGPELTLPDTLSLLGYSEFTAQLRHPDRLQLGAVAGEPLSSQFNLDVSATNHIQQIDVPAVVTAVTGAIDVELHYVKGEATLLLGASSLAGKLPLATLSLPEATREWLGWGESVGWSWHNPGGGTLSAAGEGRWSLRLHDNLLVVGDPRAELRWSPVDLDVLLQAGTATRLQAVPGLSLHATLATRVGKKAWPPLQLALKHDTAPPRSKFELRLGDTAKSIALELLGSVNPDNGNGNYKAALRTPNLPLAVTTVMPLLKPFHLLAQPLEIAAGEVRWDSEISSRGFSVEGLRQQSNLDIAGLRGRYGDYRFEGLDLAAQWSGIGQWRTRQPASITVDRLFVGFDLSDTLLVVAMPDATPLAKPVLSIKKFQTGIFGGRVFLPQPQRWDFGAETNAFTVRAEGWQLANIVALQPGQDIFAEGVLEGELPLTIADGRVLIDGGYLRARAPGGLIKYVVGESSKAVVANSPELSMAADLLDNFQFQTLSSKVQLDRQGNLLLGLSLAGKNPGHYAGRPVEFNINLEQNLDPLLQSLRLSGNLVKQLENRIR